MQGGHPRTTAFLHSMSIILAMIGQPGDEYHLVFKSQALQGVHDKYPNPFGDMQAHC